MFGASMGRVKALYEIVTFADYREIKETHILLGIIHKNEASLGDIFEDDIEQHTGTTTPSNDAAFINEDRLLSTTVREWGRIQCFIVFVELCRLLIPELQDIVVAPADGCFVPGDQINEYGTRDIPTNVIYRVHG
jgi:hypothetical protein